MRVQGESRQKVGGAHTTQEPVSWNPIHIGGGGKGGGWGSVTGRGRGGETEISILCLSSLQQDHGDFSVRF